MIMGNSGSRPARLPPLVIPPDFGQPLKDVGSSYGGNRGIYDMSPGNSAIVAGIGIPHDALRVIDRVRSAVQRSNRPYEHVFRGFCRSAGNGSAAIMTRADLARVLNTFEHGLEQDVVARLWRVVANDSSVGMDFAAFRAWFCPGGHPLPHHGASYGGHITAPSPSHHMDDSGAFAHLLDQSAAFPGLSTPTSGGMLNRNLLGQQTLLPNAWQTPTSPLSQTWPAMPRSLDPPVSPDWQHASTQGLSTPQNSMHASLQSTMLPQPLKPDEVKAVACIRRLGREMNARQLSVNSAFTLYDEGVERALSLERFVAACEFHNFPLARYESEALFNRMVRNTPTGRRISFEDLESEMRRFPDAPREETWAKDLVKVVDGMARKNGASLEALFKQTQREAIPTDEVKITLSRDQPLSNAQWEQLLPMLDKQPDGRVPWQKVLSWAGVEPLPQTAEATPPVPAAAPAPAASPAAPAVPAAARVPAVPRPVAASAYGSPAPAVPRPTISAPASPTNVARPAVGATPASPAVPSAPPSPSAVPRPAVPSAPASPATSPAAAPRPVVPGSPATVPRPVAARPGMPAPAARPTIGGTSPASAPAVPATPAVPRPVSPGAVGTRPTAGVAGVAAASRPGATSMSPLPATAPRSVSPALSRPPPGAATPPSPGAPPAVAPRPGVPGAPAGPAAAPPGVARPGPAAVPPRPGIGVPAVGTRPAGATVPARPVVTAAVPAPRVPGPAAAPAPGAARPAPPGPPYR